MKIHHKHSLMEANTAAVDYVRVEGLSASVIEVGGDPTEAPEYYGWVDGLEWRTATAAEQRGVKVIVHIKPPGPRGRASKPRHAGGRMVSS